MARRGRKSESSLTVVPLVPGTGRPPPPRGLDKLERRVWNSVVDALPAHWLDSAGQQILRRAVSLAAICERQEARLRELRALEQHGSEEALKLVSSIGNTSKTIGYLLGQLRATPRSRDRARAAGSKIQDAPVTRPWEIKAHGGPA
jgi:hypothetical protein